MKIEFHYIRVKLTEGTIKIAYMETGKMVDDMMTRALGRILFIRFRNMLLDRRDEEGHSL
jgi:hypothetical protein